MSDNATSTPTADAAGADADKQTAEPAEQPTFTQADLDRILADRLGRQEKKLRRQFEEEAEKKTEEDLADAAEWQTLAEKRQKQITKMEQRVTELEQQAETADKYGKALDTYVQQLADGLPESILTLLGGMDQAAKLEWLTANRAQFVKDETPETPDKPQVPNGVPPTPPPADPKTVTDEERRAQAYFPRL
ncbi:MAG: DUF4355 domain-containing protein [Ardenticatenaceae bacterium]|nr:DUF4355 domain-containing protein [Anaerolineales bacterium]MCB8923009.1 DUF4355 domain-containing protein [Ardenticatenaceae bacterium]